MPVWPEPLQSLFVRAASRLRLLAVANAVSLALVLSLPLLVARLWGVLSLAICLVIGGVAVIVSLAIAAWRSPRRPEALAAAIRSKTVLVTGDRTFAGKARKFLEVMNARMVLDEI